MIEISTTLLHGLLICVPFSIFALGSFWWRPRLWLHSLPPDIKQMTTPKTEAEKRQTRYLLLPVFLLILPGLSIASVMYVAETNQIDLSFAGILVHIYGIWMTVHIWDFLVIDCGFILLNDPQHPPIPGTEAAKGWKDYGFHFRALLRATVMSALFVAPASAVLYFVL
jgi:hypothetical protein